MNQPILHASNGLQISWQTHLEVPFFMVLTSVPREFPTKIVKYRIKTKRRGELEEIRTQLVRGVMAIQDVMSTVEEIGM